METLVRRCPFLSRVSQTFLQKAGKSLVSYAQNCPVMMDLASRPLARTLATSAAHCQQTKETTPTDESKKLSKTFSLGYCIFDHIPCFVMHILFLMV